MWATYPPETGERHDRLRPRGRAGTTASGRERTKCERPARPSDHERIAQGSSRLWPSSTSRGPTRSATSSRRSRSCDAPRYFARIDAILGDYRELAEKRGRRSSSRPITASTGASRRASSRADNHRDEGIVLRYPKGPLPHSVIDICPTLLELLGMPRDVDAYRRSYRRAPAAAPTPAANEEIAKLKALGYIGGSEPSTSSSTRTAGSFSNEGLILRELGRADDAIAAFENALRVDPQNDSAKWNLSRSLLLRGKDALKRKDCAAALKDFARAAELAPNDALAFASRGTAQLCLGDERAAQASFRRSLDIDPNQPLN